ncbi:aminotransferase class III-fold pyridoxal phosphate-dependent enzyme [Phreatobacter aquaticus]|uniref:Aminotransferase class III-fold pyridoxal phosphate-dependent enzyme n=1 Tax=Phreatobacter aquaticus TaxID=2570229 RepID=A0A4D7QKD5_9HYPH|nr:aminotransferase class III-fold pyridoxal phosphate-dependent enzyme [Phreatobacter aquaticus]QCK88160.1 aminotransferase class III-fold pyridoxal phosphate-dependent enzyme [Phreatobacter aquaticus]
MTHPHLPNSADTALRARAAKVIPGGLWGHLNAKNLPEGYPQYFRSGEGCRLVDVDGNSYVDFMCSWGPVVLGHHHPAVEAAAEAQRRLGDTLNGPAPVLVDLAERMVDMIPHADWCLFQKNGGDATTACVTIARAGTGKRKLLVAKGSYHGAVPWCSPSMAGVTTEDRAHILHYDYNDIASLEAAVDQAGGDLAAILVTAFRHDMARALDMPDPAFARRMRELCDETGAALILDDVRAGFRLHLGGSWETIGVRPDLSAWSKAIANGYPLGAITGAERWREPATKIFTTGSFWCEAVPMAAALATLTELVRLDGPAHMKAMGERLRAGLSAGAAKHGITITHSGPPQMPLMLFADDADFAKGSAFCSASLRAGAYFHPKHNMFLSCAHTPADIDRAIEAADAGFAMVAAIG